MKQYVLSIMRGQRKDFFALLFVFLLFPFSLLYALSVIIHRQFYYFKGRFKAPKPVISIGNITVGGSGKTPLVVWLARTLQNKGRKSIILTRGYMPKAAKVSDEVDMLNQQIPFIPVLVGADRVHQIRMAENILPVDVYICDDAFQHWPLKRDLDMVAIDAVNPFGNGYLLPAGVLREPLNSLKRADVIILTKTNGVNNTEALISKLKTINPEALLVESSYKSTAAVDVFGGQVLPEDFLHLKSVAAFCAIGDPNSFESSLKNIGVKLARFFPFMDHHTYTKNEIEEIIQYCRTQNIEILVTTHKDAVKLQEFKRFFNDLKVVYIPIQLEITRGYEELIQKIFTTCFS